MKEILQKIFKSNEERIKNPIIGPFITFWIFFNWKPILFLIFSSKIIEDNVRFIDENFVSITHFLLYPLITSILYVIVLPYLGIIVDILQNHSLLKRNEIVISKQKQNVETQKQLAIEEMKLEEAKVEYRERNNPNKIIGDLQKKFAEIENNLLLEREKNFENLKEINKEVIQIQSNHQKDILQYKNQISNLTDELIDMRERLLNADREMNYIQGQDAEKRMRSNEKEEIITLRTGKQFIRRIDGNKSNYIDKMDGLVYTEAEFSERFLN